MAERERPWLAEGREEAETVAAVALLREWIGRTDLLAADLRQAIETVTADVVHLLKVKGWAEGHDDVRRRPFDSRAFNDLVERLEANMLKAERRADKAEARVKELHDWAETAYSDGELEQGAMVAIQEKTKP